GWWRYRVEGWSDPWATWVRDATVKVRADVDTRLMLDEGVLLLRRALADPTRGIEGRLALRSALEVLEGREEHHPTAALHLVTTGAAAEELLAHPVRELVTGSADLALLVERERALYGSLYEIFPRRELSRRGERRGRCIPVH